ncbi:hypothetical protein EUX98_g4974 [Antrodiella citrinella]|uniref:PPM-type phosphatase domain-containing protein n=1 Tax=Antrodiella citrinella TaxID=2447956 RepID=A0A4S4MV63_9APHY|nr:hypothetical protein EUX98_g4974 [Antrodiella citrinella]
MEISGDTRWWSRRKLKFGDDEIKRRIWDPEPQQSSVKILRARTGTTALVVLVDPAKTIHIANVGDCQAVICEQTGTSEWRARLLTEEHNCANPEEAARVRKQHSGKDECIQRNRMLGKITVSRALGDMVFKLPYVYTERVFALATPPFHRNYHFQTLATRSLTPPYLTTTADIRDLRVSTPDPILVLASDGLVNLYNWNYLSAGKICGADTVVFQPRHSPEYDVEDRFSVQDWILPNGTWKFLGIFDGHGAGIEAVQFVTETLPSTIRSRIGHAVLNDTTLSDSVVANILQQSITDIDEQIKNDVLAFFPGGPEEISQLSDKEIQERIWDPVTRRSSVKIMRARTGTTALVVLVDPAKTVHIANVVLASDGLLELFSKSTHTKRTKDIAQALSTWLAQYYPLPSDGNAAVDILFDALDGHSESGELARLIRGEDRRMDDVTVIVLPL